MDPIIFLHQEQLKRGNPLESSENATYRYAWLDLVMRVYQHAERESSSAGLKACEARSSGELSQPLLGSVPVVSEKPWLMKDPNHSKHLPELLAQFPDAKLIFTHRPPKDIIASLAKLFVSSPPRCTYLERPGRPPRLGARRRYGR